MADATDIIGTVVAGVVAVGILNTAIPGEKDRKKKSIGKPVVFNTPLFRR